MVIVAFVVVFLHSSMNTTKTKIMTDTSHIMIEIQDPVYG